MAVDATMATPQELADRLLYLTEDLKNAIFDVYISPPSQPQQQADLVEDAHDNNNNNKKKLFQIAKELYDMCRSRKQSGELVEQFGVLTQKHVDDAKMYLFLTRLLQTFEATTTYASLVASVRRALVLATNTDTNGTAAAAAKKRSLVLELLLDPRGVEQQLNNNPPPDGRNVAGVMQQQQQQYRLLDLPRRSHDEYGNPYITGGLFDLQDCVQAMQWRVETRRPTKKRRRVVEDSNAQLSLAYILVTMVYDALLQAAQQEEQPLTVHDLLQEIYQLRMFSPVLDNSQFANNAPFWFLFDTLLLGSSSSSNNNRLPTDLALTFVQTQLCSIRSSAITVLEKACSSSGSGAVSDYALLARCGEMIMDFGRDDDDEARQVRTAIQSKLFLNWKVFLHNLVLKKQQQQSVHVLAATAADTSRSPKTTTWRGSTADRARGGTKRSMQDVVNSSNHSIDDPDLSLREKLALPEYPLFILVKLLLMHRELNEAILIVVTMEKDDVFDYPILSQAYKLLFEFIADDGHLLFDTSTVVPPVQSLHCTFFPLVGRNGIRILAHLHCGVLERIQELQQTPESTAMMPELAFVRHSCLRALLRMLCKQYTLQEGLKHYEELRRDGRFAAVLDGPLSIERAKDICEHECQLPASGFPDLMALLLGPQEHLDEEVDIAPVSDFDQNVALESALPFVAEAVARPPSVSATAILLVESEEEDEFYDTHQHLQEEEEDHGYDAAEESQGEPQPEDMAMVDSTLLVHQPRQDETTGLAPPPPRPGDDDDGYVATAEDSQGQGAAKHVNVATRLSRSELDDGYDATAEESQGQDDVAPPPLTRKRGVDYDADNDSQGQTEEDEEVPAASLKERKPEAISTEAVVKPVVAAASVQETVASRPDDSIPNQDYGYDAEESQGHSDEEDAPMNVPHAALHQQPDNGYDAEESQAGHFTEEGSVEFESTTGHQVPAAATNQRHVAFAPVVQPVVAQPEDDPGYLPEEDEVAVVLTERDGYQGGESSVQHSDEEEEVSETLPSTDDEPDENQLAALGGQADGADESPVHEPRHPSAAHSSSDMDAADEQTMDPEEDVAHEDSDHDDHDDDDDDDDDDGSEDMQNFQPSGGAVASRGSLHEYAAAAQDQYSPGNRLIRADNGREVAPTPGSRVSSREDIIILDDSSSSDETESEDSGAPPDGSSQPQEPDYDEADEQEVDDDEEEMESSVYSTSSPARKLGEEHQQDSSTYGSPSRQRSSRAHEQKEEDWSSTSSPQDETRAYGEDDQLGAASSTYSTPSSERKRPAEETSLPTRDEEAAADVAVDGDGDSLGGAATGTVNPKQASAVVNEAGSGSTADTTMEDVAETVNDGAPRGHEMLEETGDGPVADTRTATEDTNKNAVAGEEAGEPPVEPAYMNVQPLEETVDAIFANADAAQEETVGASIAHAGAVQPSQEVVELLDSDSDDAEMDNAEGVAPLEEDSDTGTDADQDSAEELDAGTADEDSAGAAGADHDEVDIHVENASEVQQPQDVVALDHDVEMLETGGDVPLDEQDAGADADHDAAAAGAVVNNSAAQVEIVKTGEESDAAGTDAIHQDSSAADEKAAVENSNDVQQSQEVASDEAEMVKAGGEPGAASGSNQNSAPAPGSAGELPVHATIEDTIPGKSHAVVSLGGKEELGHGEPQVEHPAEEEPVATVGISEPADAKVEAAVAVRAPTGDMDDHQGNNTSDAFAVGTQAEVTTGEVKAGDASAVGEQESPAVDVTANQPESKLTDDRDVQTDASIDGKIGAKDAEGEEGDKCAANEAVVHATEMPVLANPLAPIPEQEVVDEITSDHDIREISTLNPTIVDEDVDHPHDQEGQDDDVLAAGSDDESGSRQSPSTRGSVSKAPQTPVRTRQAAKTTPQRTTPQRKKRVEVGDDDIGSIASNTRSAKKKRVDEGDDDGSFASNTRGSSAKKNRAYASSDDGGSIASNTRGASAKKKRDDVRGDDGRSSAPNTRGASAKKSRRSASSDDGGSIASHTRASAKKKRRDVGDDDDGGSSAPNTRARGKQGGIRSQATPRGSNTKPPRPPPSSKKKK